MIRALGLALVLTLASMTAHAADATRIGEVSTTFRMVGPNDKIVIDRFDDPKVENVSCYVSRAETGGLKGAVGMAEDPSRFSIACRAVGPVKILADIDKSNAGEVVFDHSASFVFKELRVSRFYDEKKDTLLYMVWSTKLVDGSPYNSITAVPMYSPGFKPGVTTTAMQN